MTSLGHTAKNANTGSPGWRPLTAVAAAVVAAHALLLQASPAQLRVTADLDDAGGKTFVTRNIELAPMAAAEVTPAAARTPKAPKTVKTAASSLKSPPNKPVAQQISAQTAPEIIASQELLPAPPAAADVPVESAATASPTQVVAATAVSPSTTPVTAINLPGSVRLQYKVVGLSKNLNYQATAELDWKTNGDSYQAMMKVSAFLVGSRSMTSVGKITGSGLAPTRFADKFKSELAAHFEADKGKVVFSANTPDALWVEGVQDRVSVFLQLAGMLAANPAGFPPGSNITFLTIGPREADTWTFIIEGEESLDLMNAPMSALKLTRKPRKEFDQKVEIWFAPSLGYLPVRSRITQHGGDFIDQQLTEVARSL